MGNASVSVGTGVSVATGDGVTVIVGDGVSVGVDVGVGDGVMVGVGGAKSGDEHEVNNRTIVRNRAYGFRMKPPLEILRDEMKNSFP
jgi:acetyltransferase-like isoleucine patch superfamily enzyme